MILFDEDRRVTGFVIVPPCPPSTVNATQMALGFQPFDSTVHPELTCAPASGICTATQQSQLDPSTLTATGSSTSEAAATPNVVIHSIGGSFFDVTFYLEQASPFTLQGELTAGNTGQFIGMGINVSVSLTGPDQSVVFQSSLIGSAQPLPATLPVSTSGVLAPGQYRLRATAQTIIDAMIPPNRSGVGSYDIIFNLPDLLVGDLNADHHVDGLDVGILLSNWSIPAGTPGCGAAQPCPSDLNDDGLVDGLDVGIMLANWTG